eukprot:TRINITY_DN28678_c0_g1_i3.p1 TRINITY_DN28678_c0_g1~~TRINITY_DN28678_c0_g1_i3.p1  ORF type:complete len:285 (+),score=43.26 TRINITY_DN28678_c0_g1_i3:218-1072(+)
MPPPLLPRRGLGGGGVRGGLHRRPPRGARRARLRGTGRGEARPAREAPGRLRERRGRDRGRRGAGGPPRRGPLRQHRDALPWNSAVHELQRRMPALGELKRCALRLHFKQWPRKWQDQRWVAERAEGGPLREVGTHWVFALLEVFGGGSVAKVRCDIAYADGPSGTLCETTAEGTLQLCSGLAVELSVLTQAPVADDVSELELEGEGGGLLFYDWACLRDLAAPAGSVPLVEDQEYGRRDSVRSLHGDGGAARPAVTAREARAAQRVIDALLRSNGRWTEVSYA